MAVVAVILAVLDAIVLVGMIVLCIYQTIQNFR